jgi:hypothetical protein
MKKEYIILLYNLILFLVFGFVYSFFIQNESDFLTVPSNRDKFSAYYFSATTHTTLGYGDITPSSTLLKLIVMIHTLLVLAGNFGIYVFLQI